MRGERARDLLGGGSDVDEQRAAVRNLRRGRHPDRLLLVGSDKAAGFVGKIFNARRDDGAAVDTGQRALVAEVVEVLADGLGGHLEAPGEIVHHDPAERAGDVHVAEDLVRHGYLVGAPEQDGVRVLPDELDSVEVVADRRHGQCEHPTSAERVRRRARRGLELLVVQLEADLPQPRGKLARGADGVVRDEPEPMTPLAKLRDRFIRPLYWETPLPATPQELGHLHFSKLDLKALRRAAKAYLPKPGLFRRLLTSLR